MDGIYETNELFDFNKLVLLSPTNTPGGNYFIKFRINESPLYIQPPKCKTKQGILKSNKRYYCDLMFTNENEKFVNWMERLESHCRKIIYENRDRWFDIELDEHDIENSFTSPLKIFKSGKYYIARTNVPTAMGTCSLKIYNENEEEIALEDIKENSDILTILEIQGIKCSTKNFQIELEMKQIMVMETKKIFEKCIFKGKSETNSTKHLEEIVAPPVLEETIYDEPSIFLKDDEPLHHLPAILEETESLSPIIINSTPSDIHCSPNSLDLEEQSGKEQSGKEQNGKNASINSSPIETTSGLQSSPRPLSSLPISITNSETKIASSPRLQEPLHASFIAKPLSSLHLQQETEESDITEYNFDLDKVSEMDVVKIKKRNEIYFELYRDAKRKAKIARDLAISSYLEAKHIKNTYLLDDFKEDSDSDFEEESFGKME